MSRLFHILMLAALVFAVPHITLAASAKEGAGERLKEVEQSLEERRKKDLEMQLKADQVKSDMDRLRQKSIAAAGVIQRYETDISWLERKISDLNRENKSKNSALDSNYSQSVIVLAALQRMSRRPPEALFVQPLSPSDTVRSAILLRSAVPMIEHQAKKLRLELAELARIRGEVFKRRTELAAALGEITKQHAKLDGLFAQKAFLQLQTENDRQEASKQMQTLADQAKSLRDLLSRLEEASKLRAKAKLQTARKTAPAPIGPSMGEAKGKLPYPAMGVLAGRYGQITKTGLTRKGVTIKTRVGAQVVAPYEGNVVFAGKFRGYGQLLILKHSGGYLTLLAGLERIDSVIGQHVLGGEPVGIMGSENGGSPILYVELRRNGRPINPLPWLSAHKGKGEWLGLLTTAEDQNGLYPNRLW